MSRGVDGIANPMVLSMAQNMLQRLPSPMAQALSKLNLPGVLMGGTSLTSLQWHDTAGLFCVGGEGVKRLIRALLAELTRITHDRCCLMMHACF